MYKYLNVQGPARDAEQLARRELREKSRQAAAANSRPAAHPEAASGKNTKNAKIRKDENTQRRTYIKTKRQKAVVNSRPAVHPKAASMRIQKDKKGLVLPFFTNSDIFGNSCDNVILHTWNRC